MTISDWLLGTCGRSHIGIYVCSRCGYELLRSGFERNFLLKSPNLQDLLPVTVAAAKGQQQGAKNGDEKDKKLSSNIVSSTPFNDSMLKDFTKCANLGKLFYKNSLVKRILSLEESSKMEFWVEEQTNYEISCGKCGSSLGHQTSSSAVQKNKFFIKKERVDLQFRST